MQESAFDKGRIAKNSILLYIRMLFTMWFNLWTTRLVLSNLGIEDMGTYGVVGSIVSFFSILTVGVTTAIQRYITFEMGRSNGHPSKVFNTSLIVIFIIAFAMILLLEVFGLLFLDNVINIPPKRMNVAWWVYQLSVITAMINLTNVPYNAVIIAHEKMDAYALISVLQVLLNWGVALCLSLISDDERLLVYAILLTSIGFVICVVYQIYCKTKFQETKFQFIFDRSLIKEIGKFAGISTTSNAIQSISAQGIILIINWTFGVGINAVYQIALQLKNSVLSFGMNIFKAISPQITKTYADGDMKHHEELVYSGSKIEIYMILFITIPFLFRAPYIMHLWLGKVPEFATSFCICSIFLSITYAGFEPIRTAVLATNRIFKFMIIPDSIYLITVLFCSYFIGKMSNSPVMMMASVVVIDILICCLRLLYASKVTFIRVNTFLTKVFLPVFKVTLASIIVCYFLILITSENIVGLIILLTTNSLLMLIWIYTLGTNKKEQSLLNSIFAKIRKKLFEKSIVL